MSAPFSDFSLEIPQVPRYRGFELIINRCWSSFSAICFMGLGALLSALRSLDTLSLVAFALSTLGLSGVRVALVLPFRGLILEEGSARRLELQYAFLTFLVGCCFAALGMLLVHRQPDLTSATVLAASLFNLMSLSFLAASPMTFLALSIPLILMASSMLLTMTMPGGPAFGGLVMLGYALTLRTVRLHRDALLMVMSEKERRIALFRQREAMMANDSVAIAISEDLRLVKVNDKFRRMLGFGPEAEGEWLSLSQVAEGFGLGALPLDRLLVRAVHRAQRTGVVKLNLAYQLAGRGPLWLRIEARLADPGSTSTRLLWLLTDNTANKRAKDEIRFLAQHDALTGLANRYQFTLRARQALVRQRERFNSATETAGPVRAALPGSKVAILCIDLDGFKAINDRYGHSVGDEVLVVVARRLGNAVRARDLVSRFGGDEFVVLLDQIERREEAAVFAERLGELISAPIEINNLCLQVGASVGLAIGPEDGIQIESLLVHADHQMYAIKQALRLSKPYRPEPVELFDPAVSRVRTSF